MTTEHPRPLQLLDVIDGIVDDTHPEGDGCPLCVALDDLRQALTTDRAAQRWEAIAREVARWYLGAGQAGHGLVSDQEVDEVLANAGTVVDAQEPHSYSPDYQAMGDCKACGHQPGGAVHPTPERREVPGQLTVDEVLVCRD